MSTVAKTAAVGLITLLLNLALSRQKEYAFAVTLSGSAVMLFIVLDALSQYISVLKGYFSDYFVVSGAVSKIIKAVGIGYITEFSSSAARDFGQTLIAAKIVFAGKTAIIILALPVIKDLLELAVSFLE